MKRGLMILIFTVAIICCTDPYSPPVSSTQVSALVVDGTVNVTDSTAQIALSRAVALSSANEPPAETGAMVTIEDEGGVTVALPEISAGMYSVKFVSSIQKQYRLHVVTTDGKKYRSDFVTAYQAPPIDSVYWGPASAGIYIYVNTYDPSAQTQYYRWKFQETWKYSSAYSPALILKHGQVVPYLPAESLHDCWMNVSSQTILVYSTTAFREDRVSKFPVTFVPANSQRLSQRYSIDVLQQAISEDQYNYWQLLQSTTQNLGGLFDPLPAQVIGNVHNENDDSELVLGYFTAGSFSTKRIFIDHYDLPESLQVLPSFVGCLLDSVPINKIPYFGDGTLFISSYGTPFPIGYVTTSTDCIDCRTQGGSTTKPSFWK